MTTSTTHSNPTSRQTTPPPALPGHGTVVVVGATGKTGRRVAAGLTDLGVDVRPVSPRGATQFVWEDEATWDAALEGAVAAYVSYVPDLAVPGAAETVAKLARRARGHGLTRVVLLSGRGEAGAQEAEQAVLSELPASGVVRCSWFMQNFSEGLLLDSLRSGTIALPAPSTAVEPFLDLDDLAAVAVHALTQPGNEGRVHELTGPTAHSLDETAAILTEATGRRVRYVEVSVEQFAEQLTAAGLPFDDGVWLGTLFGEILDGRNALPTDGVERAVGRPATSLSTWAHRVAATGGWS
ncbi:NmrA family transcriptional regulator [Intrasporangium sp.]|uniref:NmrA family transcriptional regulator n=1 Tax=Intrasporangium sp. TaxID=1925024 RepID=UPI00293A8005|nr:NmrA family transcriptional regulator [Intrasporangium sp.]MDV3220542.1 NmrA family transcriptional regulator [Intrasporangium sp.]